MGDKDKSRVRVLELIRSQRETLFGAFSPSLTKVDKYNAWESITDEAKSLGLIAANKMPNYMRDVYWQNLRKRTMKKIDDYRATGSSGGNDAKLDDIDHIVLDIIGRESTVLNGLDIPESYSSIESLPIVTITQSSDVPLASQSNVGVLETTTSQNFEVITVPHFERNVVTLSKKADLQIKLLELQVQNAKREIYARELTIFEKERMLTEQEKKDISETCESIYNRNL